MFFKYVLCEFNFFIFEYIKNADMNIQCMNYNLSNIYIYMQGFKIIFMKQINHI